MTVRWSLIALRRVSEIVDYIARDDPDAARAWVTDLFDVVDQLKRFPLRGRTVPEIDRPSVRELLFGEYRVIYRIDARRVGVLTVRHGRRRLDPREVRRR